MPGDMCIVCKNIYAKDPNVFLRQFQADPARQDKWLSVFKWDESEVKSGFTLLGETQH